MDHLTDKFTIQGYTFTLRETTQENVENYINHFNRIAEKMKELQARHAAGEEVSLSDVPDVYEMAVERLRMLCTGPVEKLDTKKICLRTVQKIEQVFFGPLMLT